MKAKKIKKEIAVKPIFILNLPKNVSHEYMESVSKDLAATLYDYHVLTLLADTKDISFEVFYSEDFTEVNLDELKEIVNKAMK